MKAILGLVILAASMSAFGADLDGNVLMQKRTMVGFAPPAHRGTFILRVLRSGVVQSIDNKNVVSTVAKLSPAVLANLTKGIEGIQTDELNRDERPPCMDAPSSDIVIQKKDGQEMTVWTHSGCRENTPQDGNATMVVDALKGLDSLRHASDYLGRQEEK